MATVGATIGGKGETEIFERRIPNDLVFKALTIAFVAFAWVTVVTLIMTMVEPFSFIQLLFDVVSAFGTVGLTTGITPQLGDLSRILLTATMFMGRLGPLTIMVALVQSSTNYCGCARRIEDRVIIG
jgi:trk system potassium uptake protein TrkH